MENIINLLTAIIGFASACFGVKKSFLNPRKELEVSNSQIIGNHNEFTTHGDYSPIIVDQSHKYNEQEKYFQDLNRNVNIKNGKVIFKENLVSFIHLYQ